MQMADEKQSIEDIVRSAKVSGDPFQESDYFALAERSMVRHWRHFIEPILLPQYQRPGVVVDLAVGHGRNTEFLRHYADEVICVDINESCLEVCRNRFAGVSNVRFMKTEGANLASIADNSVDLVYCFDAMVHFEPDVVRSYLIDIARVLKPGARAFLHHSNWTAGIGQHFQTQPHWRNHMSRALFAKYATEAGLDVMSQRVFGWDESIPNPENDPNFLVNSDCISVLRSPPAGALNDMRRFKASLTRK